MHYLEQELRALKNSEVDIISFMSESLFDGIWFWDVENPENEWMDERFWLTFGYEPSEMPFSPESWQKIVHPEDLKVAYIMIEKLIMEPSYKYDQILRYTHKKGHTIWIRCRGKAIRNNEGRVTRVLGLHQDISAHKRIEFEMQEQIGRFNEVIQRTGMTTWRLLTENDQIIHSDNFYEQLGYSRAVESMTLSQCMELLHPADSDEAKAQFQKLLNQEVEFLEFEGRFRKADNSYVWKMCKASIIKLSDAGAPLEIGGYTENIHQRKLVEMEVLQYKNFLEQINKAARIGTWIVQFQPSFEMIWDPMIYDIHEATLDTELTVENGISFYKEGESRDRIEYLFNRASEKGEPFDAEFEIITQKGNTRHVRSIGIPVIENGVCVRVQGVFHDIDDRVLNLQRIDYERERFFQTYKFAPIGLAMVNTSGEFIDLNPSFARILGYNQEELIGKSFAEITHPDDLQNDLDNVNALIEGTMSDYSMEKRYFNKNGEVVWAILNVSCVKNKEGELIHFISQIKDITEEKMRESEIRNLLTMNTEQKNRLLNFAHIISHNLRSHSSNISMILELLSKEYQNIEQNEYYKMLHTSAHQLEETIYHLNDVVHIDKSVRDQMRALDLLPYLNQAIESLEAQVSKKKAIIHRDIEAQIHWKVMGIPAYLESILYNVLSNAIKYSKNDEAPRIDLSVTDASPYVNIVIRDYGVGIDMEKYGHRLFRMYSRLGIKTGKGLGLFITKNQVEALGGEIQIESTPDNGTSVQIRLINAQSELSAQLLS